MLDKVPLVGNVGYGFGEDMPISPTEKMPNIEEATEDFVGLLYSYVFQQMRSSGTDEENSLFGGENASMFMGFLDQAVGQELARTDGASLAKEMLKQLKGQSSLQPLNDDPLAQEKEREAQLRSAGMVPNLKPVSDESEQSDDTATEQILQHFAKMNGG